MSEDADRIAALEERVKQLEALLTDDQRLADRVHLALLRADRRHGGIFTR